MNDFYWIFFLYENQIELEIRVMRLAIWNVATHHSRFARIFWNRIRRSRLIHFYCFRILNLENDSIS